MTMTISVAGRNAELSALVTLLGSGAKAKWYNGTKPASLGTPGGTLLATLVFGTDVTAANGGSAGGVASGVLTFGGFTQTNSSHVNGTPTFLRLTKSDDTATIDIDVGSGAGTVTFTGTIANGQNITGSLTLTAGNA